MLLINGGPAHSAFRLAKLLELLRSLEPQVTTLQARYAHLVDVAAPLDADGLALLRRLLGDLPARAAPRATVLLEIGVGQVDAITALAPPGASVSVVPDLAGLDRVVRVGMPG